MSKLLTLAKAQAGSVHFEITTRTGKIWKLDIAAMRVAGEIDIIIRKDRKHIGSVSIDGDNRCIIWGNSSIMDKKMVQLIIEETDREDSIIAPAWKQAILHNLENRVELAQKALELGKINLENI